MNRRNTPRVSFIGFGEAGQAIASGLRESGIERIAAWDILFPDPQGEKLKAAGESIGVRLAKSAAEAAAETDMIISAVTAASSVEAARSVAPHLKGAPYYLDINSVSPRRKQETARLLGETARYVDVAVIAPIHPARHKTPLLISGPHAEAISPLLEELEMKLTVVGANTGQAAAIKMIRSVMIKGMEALTLECFLAASRAGVLDEVTVSMKNNYPSLDWTRSPNTTWSAWPPTASAAPPRWKNPPRPCANSGSIPAWSKPPSRTNATWAQSAKTVKYARRSIPAAPPCSMPSAPLQKINPNQPQDERSFRLSVSTVHANFL